MINFINRKNIKLNLMKIKKIKLKILINFKEFYKNKIIIKLKKITKNF